jgi:hypothetical protein
MATPYVVTAPLAVVRNTEHGGRQEYLYQGAPVPSYVSSDEVKRLSDDGLIASTGDAESVTPATSPDQLNPDVLVPSGKSTSDSGSGTRTMAAGDDPADFTVGEVQAFLADADDAERTRVLDAESSGKNRTSITGS